MPRFLRSPSTGDTIVTTLKVYEGGLGVTTTPEVVSLLGAVPLTDVNAPNGVAGLNANGTIDGSIIPGDSIGTVSIVGPSSITMQGVHKYLISNYDLFSTYELSAISGSVQRDKDLIIYTPPATDIPAGFVINGKTYNLTLVTSKPAKPTVAGTHAAGSGNTAAVNLNSSAFSMTYGTRTHLNSDWQISVNPDYSTISKSVSNSIVNKTGYIVDGLALNTTYYARVRHRDDNSNVSDWSNSFSFSTSASYGSTEQAKLLASNRVTISGFGITAAIDDTATRVAVGSPLHTSEQGLAYVFTRSGLSWSQEKIAVPSDPTNNSRFGSKVALDADATRLFVGSPNKSVGFINEGAVYVFLRTGTTWAQEQKIAGGGSADTLFGSEIVSDATGSRVAIGVPAAGSNAGRVQVYTRSGTVWSLEATITAMDAASGSKFGKTVAMTPDGTKLVIAAPNDNTEGSVYVYGRSGTVWSPLFKLDNPEVTTGSFGEGLCISDDGTRIAISDPTLSHPTFTLSPGVVYFYKQTVDTWEYSTKIYNTQNNYAGHFGTTLSCNGDMSKISISAYEFVDLGGSITGRVHQYTRTNDNWNSTNILKASDGVNNAILTFGQGMAMARTSNQVIIGDRTDSTGGVSNGGSAYFFS